MISCAAMEASEVQSAGTTGELSKEIERMGRELTRKVQGQLTGWLNARNPGSFRETELEISAVAQKFADQVTGLLLEAATRDLAFRAETSSAVRAAGVKLLDGGARDVEIQLLGGGAVRVRTNYFRPDLSGRPGRKRGHGRRGPGGAGVYPVLAALGVAFGVSPALAVEICRQVADSDSVRAGRSALDRRGIDLGHKQTLRIFNGFAQRAVEPSPPTQKGPRRRSKGSRRVHSTSLLPGCSSYGFSGSRLRAGCAPLDSRNRG